ncbi:MAG TPA: segregation/condensation protein A, partial [Pseudobdellovibrionaceae bacterium]|nr:segregation/condensation protein A [Pseudobdellovibrionaceae bacterium]
MSLNVLLPKFEGPLGLLLYLIRKEEMSIMDINIHEITKQYLDFIKLMKELDLELASDFIFMASTLIQIKSKMLLPQYNEEGEIIETEDPRKELVQRLLDYQKFQEAAKKLNELSWLGRNVWARGMPQDFETGDSNSDVILEENGLFQMISAYRKMMRSVKNKVHQVAEKVQSIASRILEIKDRLLVGHRVLLTELLSVTDGRSRQLLITFLSLLELGKLGLVHLYQTEPYSDLWVEARRTIETDVISHVE